jgi:hypothetical protein
MLPDNIFSQPLPGCDTLLADIAKLKVKHKLLAAKYKAVALRLTKFRTHNVFNKLCNIKVKITEKDPYIIASLPCKLRDIIYAEL